MTSVNANEKVNENIDKTKPYFQCIKTSLKSVVKNPVVIEKLTNAALLINRITTHTLQFMKLYSFTTTTMVSPYLGSIDLLLQL